MKIAITLSSSLIFTFFKQCLKYLYIGWIFMRWYCSS